MLFLFFNLQWAQPGHLLAESALQLHTPTTECTCTKAGLLEPVPLLKSALENMTINNTRDFWLPPQDAWRDQLDKDSRRLWARIHGIGLRPAATGADWMASRATNDLASLIIPTPPSALPPSPEPITKGIGIVCPTGSGGGGGGP